MFVKRLFDGSDLREEMGNKLEYIDAYHTIKEVILKYKSKKVHDIMSYFPNKYVTNTKEINTELLDMNRKNLVIISCGGDIKITKRFLIALKKKKIKTIFFGETKNKDLAKYATHSFIVPSEDPILIDEIHNLILKCTEEAFEKEKK